MFRLPPHLHLFNIKRRIDTPDFWSYFEACDIIKGIYSSFNVEEVKMWWKSKHGSLENDLKPLVNDEDASLLAMCAEETKCDVEIYTEAKSCRYLNITLRYI